MSNSLRSHGLYPARLLCPWILGFSRQEYWSGLPFPSSGDFPNPGIKPVSLTSLALAGGFFTTATTPKVCMYLSFKASWTSDLLSFIFGKFGLYLFNSFLLPHSFFLFILGLWFQKGQTEIVLKLLDALFSSLPTFSLFHLGHFCWPVFKLIDSFLSCVEST